MHGVPFPSSNFHQTHAQLPVVLYCVVPHHGLHSKIAITTVLNGRHIWSNCHQATCTAKHSNANNTDEWVYRLATALALRTWGAGEVCLHEDLLLHLCNPKSETSRQGCEFRYACLQVCSWLACCCDHSVS